MWLFGRSLVIAVQFLQFLNPQTLSRHFCYSFCLLLKVFHRFQHTQVLQEFGITAGWRQSQCGQPWCLRNLCIRGQVLPKSPVITQLLGSFSCVTVTAKLPQPQAGQIAAESRSQVRAGALLWTSSPLATYRLRGVRVSPLSAGGEGLCKARSRLLNRPGKLAEGIQQQLGSFSRHCSTCSRHYLLHTLSRSVPWGNRFRLWKFKYRVVRFKKKRSRKSDIDNLLWSSGVNIPPWTLGSRAAYHRAGPRLLLRDRKYFLSRRNQKFGKSGTNSW